MISATAPRTVSARIRHLYLAIAFGLVIGMIPIGIGTGTADAAASFRSSSSANSGATNVVTIAQPAGLQTDDVMLAAISRDGTTSVTPPAGWTLIRSDASGGDVAQDVFYKVATASEPADYTFTLGIVTPASGAIAVYSGVDTANPIDAHGGQGNGESSNITAPSITTTVDDATLVGFFANVIGTSIAPPAGMTERADQNSVDAVTEIADELLGAAGPTGTRVATGTEAGLNVGQLVALAPATTAGNTITVNSTGDAGDNNPGDDVCDTGGTVGSDPECTLRGAIEEANASATVDTINFDIPTSDAGYSASPLSYTFTPASQYPFITEALVLDGTTQPGHTGDPIIQLDGSGATGASGGLIIRANDSTIRGFIVHSFPDEGLEIDGSTGFGDGNVLANNWVGVDAGGTVVGNADQGILVTVDALNNMVGGTGANDGNVVAGSGTNGILVRTDSTGNSLLGNSVYSNGLLGIDLDEDGVTANDAGDPDTGSNDLLNYPVITSATESAGTVTVAFDLDVPANPDQYRVEFFTNPSGADGSGFGEGETFVSAFTTAPGTGLTHTFSGSVGDVITATATRIDAGAASGYASTSEFSQAETALAAVDGSLWFSTTDGVASPSGAPGLDSWSRGSILQFADPGLALEPPTTSGTFSLVEDISAQAQGGVVVLHGLDVVDGSLVVGAGPSVALQAGDLLLSTKDNTTFVNADTSTTVTESRDVVLFRPETPGDYSAGTFSILLDDPLGGALRDFSVVETETTVGSVTLPVGSFLLGQTKQVFEINPVAAGPGQSPGTATLLIDGPDASIDQNIDALHLVDIPTEIAGVTLEAGTLVLSSEGNEGVGDNEVAVERHDLYSIRFLTDSVGASIASGNATLLFDGSDVGLDTNVENVVGVVLDGVPVAPPTTVAVNATSDAADATPGDEVCDTGGTNSEGDPECTLRAAIQEANASATIDAIHFAIPVADSGHSGGVWTITPGSAFAPITELVTIDGTTQTGWTSVPIIEIDGVSTTSATGLTLSGTSDGSTVTGLRVIDFDVDGVFIATGADLVTISNSWIGSDGTGSSVPGNGDDGIDINGTNAVIDGNVINHNGDEGIDVRASGATIIGNIVGLESDGTSGSGNGDVGIAVFSDNTTIGGSTAAQRNVISANFEGIEINSSNNVVQGNYIGTDATGTAARGNDSDDGVEINSGSGNLIGGTTAGEANVIAFNQLDGVNITGGTGHSVLGNSIYSNGQQGIDLAPGGVTANDAGDGDTGPNDLLNYPVITSATESGGTVTVTFDLDVPANPDQYRVEFFANPSGGDASGHGEGETFLSAVTTAPGTGLTHTFSGSVGDVITATATRIDSGAPSGFSSTSELSAGYTVTGGSTTTVSFQEGTSGYSGTVDTWVSDSVANQDNSADPLIQIDNSAYQQGLIRFDNIIGPGAGQIPAGATIVSAELTFVAADFSTADATLSVHRVLRSWVETDTWNTLTSGISIDDSEASVATDSTLGSGLDLVDTPVTVTGLGSAVQAWVDGTANNGWLLVIDSGNGWDPRSSENSTVAWRPLLTVEYANAAPTATDDSYSTPEDTPLSVAATGVLGNDTDPESDPLTAALVSGPSNAASFTLNGDGSFTYTPIADFNGSDSFTYTTSDGSNTSNTATVTITVSPVNDAPVAVDDSATTTEDTAIIINVVGNDTDLDGDALVVGTFSQGTNGSVSDNGDGTVTYTPGAEFSGSDSFTYTASDGTDTSNTATVTLNVTAVNDAPVAVDDSATTNEDTAVTFDLIGNDTDAEGDTISVAGVGAAGNGSVVNNGDGTVTYTPSANFNGSDSFTYTATDGTDTSNSATVTVTVTPVNDAPVAVDDAATTAEDTAIVIDLLGNDTDVEGDTLSFVSVSNGGNGSVVDNGDGTVTYTPDANWNGSDSFVYSITDGTDNSNVATVTVTVTPVGDPPVAVGDSATTAEDTAVVIDLVVNDTDPDGDSLLVGSIVEPTNGSVTNNGDGTVTYTPNPNYNGTESFTYTATDGANPSSSATVWVTVTPVNDAPVAVDDSASTAEDTAVIVSVLANDTDVDGDTLSIDSYTQPTNGTVTDNGDGTLTYTPDANYSGSDSFTYVANDGTMTSNTATVTMTVNAVNDAPVASDDAVSTPEDTAVVIGPLGNDADPEGDTLSIDSFTQPTNGTVTDNGDGTLTYTPDPDYFGPDSFTYVATDGTDTSNTATVTVTVTSVNDAPTAVDDSATTAEDTAVVIDLLGNDTDPEGDSVSIQGIAQPSNGTVVDNGDGTVTYTPDADFNGSDPFTYSVTDGTDPSNVATVSVTVTSVNDAPVAISDSVSTNEDSAVIVPVLANDTDVDGGILSVDSFTQPTNGTVTDNGDGTLTYTPDANFNGSDSFTYVASDGTATSNTATVSITVSSVNDAPVAVGDSASTSEDTAVIVSVLANDTDVDGDTLSIDSFTQPSNGTVTDNGDGTVTYTPAANYSGADSFTYVASDGAATSNSATVSVTVAPVNDIPVAVDDTTTTNEDTAVAVAPLANDTDADGDPLSIDSFTQPTNGTVTDNGDGTLTYTPNPDFNGGDTFTYVATDGAATSNSATVSVTVAPVNDVPVAVDDSASTNEDTAVILSVLTNDSDTDGDTLSIDSFTQPTNGAVTDNGDGTVTYTPDANFSGPDSFTYVASDGTATSNTATVTLIVDPLNDPPVAGADSATTAEDTALVIDVLTNDTDADGDPLSVIAITQGSNGTVVDNGDGTVTYTPDPDFNGSDSFTYTVSDGNGGDVVSPPVSVTVTPVNDAPVANDDSGFTSEDTAVGIDLVANDVDVDGDSLTFVGLSNGANGSVTDNGDGTITYTPNADFNGTDTFVYSVTDGTTNSNAANVTVTISAVSDAPVAVDDTASTDEDTAVIIDVVTNDTDADGDVLLVDTFGQGANGTVTDNGDGTVTYTPNVDFNGTDSFTYVATDGALTSNSATVTVTVNAANDAPVAVGETATTSEDLPVVIDVIGNDTDVDGDALSVDSVTQGSNGTVTSNGDGTVTYTPDADFNGSDSFTYVATDGALTSNTAVVGVTVTAVADAPVASDDAASTNEDSAVIIDVAGNDSDIDGDLDPTTIAVTVTPSSGTAGPGPFPGLITYSPTSDFNGSDSFTYQICDATALCATAVVSITVNPANDAPSAVDDAVSTTEDTAVTVSILANDTDVDGDPLSIDTFTQGTNGTVTDNGDGTVTYTPALNFNGSDSFTYAATDGTAGSNIATVSVTVGVVNDAPLAVDDATSTVEDTAVVVSVLANDTDVDGDAVSIVSVSTPTSGIVIDNGDGTLTYTPDADFNGTDTFTYSITDGVDTSNAAVVSLTVTAANDAPVAVDDTAVTLEDAGVVVDLIGNDSDVDGDTLTLSSVGTTVNGTVVDNGDGTITYTPAADFNGADTFAYSVTDGTTGSNVATVSVTVNAVNDAPVAIDDAASTSSGRSTIIDVLANDIDPDGDALSVVGISGENGGSAVDNGDGTVTFQPSGGFSGTGSFTYTVSDGALSDTGTVTITVSVTNSPPTVSEFRSSIPETTRSGDVIGVVTADDPEGNGMIFAVSGDARLSIDGSGTLTLVGTVTAGDLLLGTVTVTDADGASAQGSVAVTVTAVNAAPEISDQTFGVDSDAAVGTGLGRVTASDPDGDDLTYSLVGSAPFAIDSSGNLTVTGSLDSLAGTMISFSVLVTDPDGLTAGASVTVGVRDVTPTNTTEAPSTTGASTTTTLAENQPPIARDDLVIGSEDIVVEFDPLKNDSDPDGDPLELTWLTSPREGTIADGYSFLSDPDWSGTTSARYRVDDGRGGSAFGTVTFVINPVNDAPRILTSTDATRVSSGGSIEIPIPRIVDPEFDGYTITIGNPLHGTAKIVGSNIVYVPNPGYEGQDTIQIFVVDTAGAGAEGLIIIEVVIDGATIAVKILDLAQTSGPDGGFGPFGGPGNDGGLAGGPGDGGGGEYVLLGIPFFGLIASEVLSATWAVRAPLIAFVVVAAVTILATTRRSFSLAVKPLPVARSSHLTWSIVLVGEFERLPALAGPGHSHKAVSWLDAGVTEVESTGNLMMNNGTLWVEIVTSGGRAWVEAKHVTPGRPAPTAQSRDELAAARRELLDRMERNEPYADLVSGRGLYMQVAGEIETMPHGRVDPLLTHILYDGDAESRRLLDALSMPLAAEDAIEVPIEMRNFEYLVVGEGWERWALYFERGADRRPLLVGVSPARALVGA